MVNPPAAEKYGYLTNPELPDTAEEWLEGATQSSGSWWGEWDRWLAGFAGKQVPARQPGDGKLTPLEDAPGAYVKVRLV